MIARDQSAHAKLTELERRRAAALAGAGPEAAEKQHARGKLTARERVEQLLDPGSFMELDRYRVHRCPDVGQQIPGDGVITGHGTIDGRVVYLYAHDFTVYGGSLGEVVAEKVCKVQELALRQGAPCIAVHDSGGARIQEGVESMSGYVDVCFRNVQSSGVIPQLALIMGPCAGGSVYSAALSDFVIMVRPSGRMFVTGPEVVKAVLGESVTLEELGGAEVHGRGSGAAHFVVEDEAGAIALTRRLLALLPANNLADPPRAAPEDPVPTDLLALVPAEGNQAFDMREVIRGIVDAGDLLEVHQLWAPNMVTGLARLGGRPVGIVANQSLHLAGTLDVDASIKAARFVRFCDAFNIPIVTFVDTPGYFPGKAQELGGIIRNGAKLAFAYCEATVPKLTVVVRKAYGGAYGSMGARNTGVDLTLAWPTAELAVMGAEGAIRILYRRELEAAPQRREELLAAYRERFASPYAAAEGGFVDDVIDPRDTRRLLVRGLETLDGKRLERPARKHGSVPL
jgi:acetyl-CoA carboxylase carboxyltransferase component